MLDAETRRKIDNARDILVGKVPDPKSQVDQITIALIYKFMDDIDQEAEELGGKTKFFTGEFEKYAWSKLMDSKLGGRDRLDLYADGIQKMNQNKNIPQLFRDIFKDAFLPYRDPETLNLFLKEINGFTYDHSEKLGDAFEYLLSVMASQGKAGQFRTPRHIIEFMVDVVDPDKNDTILDPACGTAGFLVSAYKHTLEKHTKDKLGDKLTPDQRERLTRNFVGYDISPDMVRLSRVNMYLHKFPSPQIYEYDTLTSEERWQDRFDVIMANPPFMSPKGGIRPHKRFAIQANRSELLFVDYIAEHLTPNGRAGVIVPEGIIFQSSNAYKSLRKMLVEDGYLWAVVSLPAGVFNPYSGVKTSILFLDKVLAKQTKNILFVKIENDGFDLGAQRRPIHGGQLPTALSALNAYKTALKENRVTGLGKFEAEISFAVPKSKITTSGDYNLSGERYKEITPTGPQKWPIVALKDLIDITTGKLNANQANDAGKYPFYTCGQEVLRINEPAFDGESILLAGNGDFNLKYHSSGPFNAYQRTYVIKSKNKEALLNKYLFHVLKVPISDILSQGGVIQYLRLPQITRIKIPLPPLEIQKQIVEELDGYQKIINGAKQVVANYKPTIDIDPDWETGELGEICKIYQPKTITSKEIRQTGKYKVFGANGVIGFYDKYNHEDAEVLVTCRGATCGTLNMSEPKSWITGNAMVVKPKGDLDKKFLFYFLKSTNLKGVISGSAQPQITRVSLSPFKIPVPPVEIQKQIVARIEAEQKLVNANKELIEVFEQNIKDKIEEVWGD